MTKPMVRINDGIEVIDREMTDDEYTQYLAENKAQEDRVIAENARADAKATLLVKLGITAEEAALLLG
jgi:hypothetical protein